MKRLLRSPWKVLIATYLAAAACLLFAAATFAADDGGLVTDTNNVVPNLLAIVGLAAPITIGLVELIKRQGLPTKFAPAITMLSALVITALLVIGDVATLTAGQTVLTGVLTGLTAAGVYSGLKATVRD